MFRATVGLARPAISQQTPVAPDVPLAAKEIVMQNETQFIHVVGDLPQHDAQRWQRFPLREGECAEYRRRPARRGRNPLGGRRHVD